MFKIDHKKAQAATELAVFGAILIFLIGTIVTSAVGNNYEQNQNFKAMRMAMLVSWRGSQHGNTSRNSATILFLEDRLSPGFNKYGALDRNPFVASGSGTFTYELLYPIDPGEVSSMLPMMDVYINGQYFPLTTATYVPSREIIKPDKCGFPDGSCAQNQCLRNQREWVGSSAGGIVNESQFAAIVPVTLNFNTDATATSNAAAIFGALASNGMITLPNASSTTGTVTVATLSPGFIAWYKSHFSGTDQAAQLAQIQEILQSNGMEYKLFYSQAVNGTPQFTVNPPTCASHPCKDKELSTDLVLTNADGSTVSNTTGDLMFDLQRTNVSNSAIEATLPTDRRPYIAWSWSATAGTTADMIGLDVSNNQYPQYDIDGRLKAVTIYGISQDPSSGAPIVSYEDYQGGDIDATWDTNSCGSKPGLQNDAQILTFTKAGTYLLIKEGKLYNPETDEFVRSANKRDTIDLIQRMMQLSNNTGRFCNGTTVLPCVANDCTDYPTNPVEVCVNSGAGSNCFTSDNIAQTCFDNSDNMLYIRSRLEDRRGHFWKTDTSGQLQVQ